MSLYDCVSNKIIEERSAIDKEFRVSPYNSKANFTVWALKCEVSTYVETTKSLIMLSRKPHVSLHVRRWPQKVNYRNYKVTKPNYKTNGATFGAGFKYFNNPVVIRSRRSCSSNCSSLFWISLRKRRNYFVVGTFFGGRSPPGRGSAALINPLIIFQKQKFQMVNKI